MPATAGIGLLDVHRSGVGVHAHMHTGHVSLGVIAHRSARKLDVVQTKVGRDRNCICTHSHTLVSAHALPHTTAGEEDSAPPRSHQGRCGVLRRAARASPHRRQRRRRGVPCRARAARIGSGYMCRERRREAAAEGACARGGRGAGRGPAEDF